MESLNAVDVFAVASGSAPGLCLKGGSAMVVGNPASACPPMIVDNNQDDTAGPGEDGEPTIGAREVVYCGICTFPPEVPSFSFSG